MKKHSIIIISLFFPLFLLANISVNDSLLKVLDETIAQRHKYTKIREDKIIDLKKRARSTKRLIDRYNINKEIINQYDSFICDSAEFYINKNLNIAKTLNDPELILENELHLTYIYSLSGLFVEAAVLFDSINFESLPNHFKAWYCWNSVRYYENLKNYVDDNRFSQVYNQKIDYYRNIVMELLWDQSDEFRKEYAFKLQQSEDYEEAIELLTPIFNKQQAGTHGYAMAAMSLAKVYKLENRLEEEQYYLTIAAITDLKLAVKENEALLSLAINVYNQGNTNRAYNYIKVALEDAIYYNARYKNSVIARLQPIIEDTYVTKIEQQQRNLRLYSILISLIVIVLIFALYINYRQVKVISKARKELKDINERLLGLNVKLDEANIVKEKYIGYFMNQCAVYIKKLDDFRKTVNRKIKTGQVESLYKSSTGELEKEIEELCINFDKAFLKLFPNYIEEFNSLLKPEEYYHKEEDGRLNTELRIFALIRLGITDVSEIAVFLHYSAQTVYNYRSKVKGKSIYDRDQFEEEIKKIGSLK